MGVLCWGECCDCRGGGGGGAVQLVVLLGREAM